MREDSELPDLPNIMTVQQVAAKLEISDRMVRVYILDGRLPAHKLGKVTAIRVEDFEAFRRAKKGRPRTRVPVWRKSVGDNLQYVTFIQATLKAGQSKKLAKRLEEFRAKEMYQLPGTVGRFIACGMENPDEVQIMLLWRSTVMPEESVRKEAIQALKDELSDLMDWSPSDIYSKVLLHT